VKEDKMGASDTGKAENARTKGNLEAAFAGESQANRRYLAFAGKADEEGKPNIARLFRAAAEAETVHAMNHLSTLAGVKSTRENLEAARDGEKYENTEMYPKFIREAREESASDAERSFDWANQVEKVHQGFYEKAIESIGSGKDIEATEFWVCQTCGNTFEGSAPDACPVCGRPSTQFSRVE
jgi:rubrerythrin